jgi:ADP-heptose:LPS heptosyltransferase
VTRRLVARLDNLGDVLMTGPAVRAVAASGDPVTYLAGPSGAAAAQLLPGVDEVLVFDAPWVAFDGPEVDNAAITKLVKVIRTRGIDEALVLTSFHQSPLPLALLLRQAGVGWIGATCTDYPGTLLDLRHPYVEELHEVEQSLEVARAAGHRLPLDDPRRLAVNLPPRTVELPREPYVVVHPGASVPARGLPAAPTRALVAALVSAGQHVVVTGGPGDTAVVRAVLAERPGPGVTVMVGGLDLGQFAHVLRDATAVVCGNTGPAHLAAAVGTPVVEAFAPVVPADRWRPWGVPHVLIGQQDIACAGCRARICPVPDQPCLDPFDVDAVLTALAGLRTTAGVPA